MPETPIRSVRVPDDPWETYAAVVEAEGTDRSADINRYILRRNKAFAAKLNRVPSLPVGGVVDGTLNHPT